MSDAILNLTDIFITVLTVAIILRSLLSWINPNGDSGFNRFLVRFTEPLIAPIRQVVPPWGRFDLSPIVAIIGLQVLLRLLSQSLG